MKNLMVSLLFIIVIISFITNFFLEEKVYESSPPKTAHAISIGCTT